MPPETEGFANLRNPQSRVASRKNRRSASVAGCHAGASRPNRNTVVTAGANVMGILLMASKMVPNWSPWVDPSIASTMMTPVVIRPMVTLRASNIPGRNRLTRTIGDRVGSALNNQQSVVLAATRRLSPLCDSSKDHDK